MSNCQTCGGSLLSVNLLSRAEPLEVCPACQPPAAPTMAELLAEIRACRAEISAIRAEQAALNARASAFALVHTGGAVIPAMKDEALK